MDPVTAATLGMGALTAATSVAQTAGGIFGLKKRERKARKYNLKMWRKTNEYNHPKAQMERLREAGLNPNLIYGTSPSSAVGNAGSMPAPGKAEDFSKSLSSMPDALGVLSRSMNVKAQQAQTDNVRKQTELTSQEIGLAGLRGSQILAQTAKTKWDLQNAKNLEQGSYELQRLSIDQAKENIFNSQLENEFKNATQIDRIKKFKAELANLDLEIVAKGFNNTILERKAKWAKLGLRENDPWFIKLIRERISDDPELSKNAREIEQGLKDLLFGDKKFRFNKFGSKLFTPDY